MILPEVKNTTVTLSYLIDQSELGNRKMQEQLYLKFATPMFYVCLRYVKHVQDAEDILQEGFIKVFKNLSNFKNEGSFEGWVRTTMIRTALSYLRDHKKHTKHQEPDDTIKDRKSNIFDRLQEKDILHHITRLPEGCKNIFILHAIEGYNHREIAGILGCSEGTCKSQFYRSRGWLQQMLAQSL